MRRSSLEWVCIFLHSVGRHVKTVVTDFLAGSHANSDGYMWKRFYREAYLPKETTKMPKFSLCKLRSATSYNRTQQKEKTPWKYRNEWCNLLPALYNTHVDWLENDSTNRIACYIRTCPDLPEVDKFSILPIKNKFSTHEMKIKRKEHKRTSRAGNGISGSQK